MHRAENRLAGILVVEGETDSRFFSQVKEESCQIVIAGGKLTVEKVFESLNAEAGLLGIVDADHDHLEGRASIATNLLLTETHDLETMILRSRALAKVLGEYADVAQLRKLVEEEGRSFRESLLARGLPFGRLRWLARRKAWNLDFKRLGPERFTSDSSWEVNLEALYAAALDQLGAGSWSLQELKSELDQLPAADPWQICQGHDLLDLLCIAFKGRFRRPKERLAGVASVTKALRLAYERADFESEPTTAKIRDWEVGNEPHRILAAYLATD